MRWLGRSGGAFAPRLLSACMVGPNFKPPVVNAPSACGDEPNDVPSQTVAGAVDATWWRTFGDPELDALMDRLARQNIDLQTAAERVVQARAQRRVSAGGLFPQIDATPTDNRQLESLNGTISNTVPSATAEREFSEFKPQGTLSWEIDLFGRVRRSIEAADATVDAQIEYRRGVALAAAAELAQDFFQLRQAQEAERVLRLNIDAVVRRSALLRQRVALGAASQLDLAQNDTQLSTIRQNLPGLLATQAQTANAIAMLLAEPPRALAAELGPPKAPRPLVPSVIPIGLPSDLARRRPDVREAEANLHAATAQTGVAVASFYPTLSLTGTAGYDSLHSATLFHAASRFFVLSPVLSLPIFHGGELRGTLALRRSQQREAALGYRKAVLQAWHDVDNALTGYAQAQHTRQEALATNAANAKLLALAIRQYEAGAVDYLNVIAAQTALYGSQTGLSQADQQAQAGLVTLYKALGGGWQTLPPVPRAGDEADLRPLAGRDSSNVDLGWVALDVPSGFALRKHRQSGTRLCGDDDGALGLALNLSTGHTLRRHRGGHVDEVRPRFGMLNLLPPTASELIEVEGSSKVILVTLSWERFAASLSETQDVDTNRVELMIRQHVEDPELTRLIIATASAGPAALESAVPLLAGRLLAGHSNRASSLQERYRGGLSPVRVRRLLDRIEEQIDSPLLLHELAASVHLSMYHFAREFARVVGVPPHSYILRRRVHRALEMLAFDTCSSAEAAVAVGFVDGSHLARQFRQQFGLALRDYRNGVLLSPA